jgi:hypothetical protein
MHRRRMAVLVGVLGVIFALAPTDASSKGIGEQMRVAPSKLGQIQGTKTTVTEYVIGFLKGQQSPFNKKVLATFPPGTQWATINAFVAKARKSGLYSSVIVTTALPPG